MYLVDTNIFLKIFFKEENALTCATFLDSCNKNSIPIFLSSFTLHSIEVMLLNRGKHDVLYSFLEELALSENIFVYPTDGKDEFEIFNLSKKGTLDFDDSFQYYVAEQANCKAIISYDSDFDKLTIPRKTPDQIILP